MRSLARLRWTAFSRSSAADGMAPPPTAAAAAAPQGALALLAPVLSLGGVLDGLSPGLQLFVVTLVAFNAGALLVWVWAVSAELRSGRRRKAAAE